MPVKKSSERRITHFIISLLPTYDAAFILILSFITRDVADTSVFHTFLVRMFGTFIRNFR